MAADEALTQTCVAALQVVPTYLWPYLPQDARKVHVERGLDAQTMKMLDALAAVCVCAPSETYSTALSLEANQITLLVATTRAVPDHVEQRLRAVWHFMRAMHDLRSSSATSSELQNSAKQFTIQQYRYALPALRARMSHDATAVLDSLRRVLEDPNPCRQLDELLLQSVDMHDFVVTDSHERLLRRCIDVLEKMRSLLANDQLGEAVLLEIALGLEKLYVATSDLLESNYGTILVLAEVICRVPVQVHLRRILWLAEACIVVRGFAVSRSFGRLYSQPLRIQRLSPLSQRVAVEVRESVLKNTANVVYIGYHEQHAFFDSDFKTRLSDPIHALLANLAVPPSDDHPSVEVPLHGEMLILQHLDALAYGSVSYIGHSELSCLPCYLFLQAYNNRCGQCQVHSRGSSGQTLFPWPLPRLASDGSDKVSVGFHHDVKRHFMYAWRFFARRLMEERVLSGVVEVPPPEPKPTTSWFETWALSGMV